MGRIASDTAWELEVNLGALAPVYRPCLTPFQNSPIISLPSLSLSPSYRLFLFLS